MADYSILLSNATLKPEPFKVHFEDQQLQDMKQLIKLSPLGPRTYENQQTTPDRRFGVNIDWMEKAKEYWHNGFDWRKCEDYINSFPNYKVFLPDSDGKEYMIHFTALFSTSTSPTTPLLFLHGWPGSFLEFLGVLDILRKKYSASDLPYNVIVPSLPGYGLSEGPSLDRQWSIQDASALIDKLMVGLGLKGYVAQGGDIGSYMSRILSVESEHCKAVHLNFNHMSPPKDDSIAKPTAAETKGLERVHAFNKYGSSYGSEHGTRPATIGVVLSSSPIALLAWVGEKFLEWTDEDPSLDTILDSVTLYWLTQSFPRAIYPYAQFHGRPAPGHPKDNPQVPSPHIDPKYYIRKPFGYSWFPYELAPIPVGWVKTTGDLTWSRSHDQGGHFAAMEKPEVLLGDFEEFVKTIG